MRKGHSKPLTAEQQAELDVLAALPEEEIDTREMPEVRDWSGVQRGVFYQSLKRQIPSRVDADEVEWFKPRICKCEDYQTIVNRVLREYVDSQPHEPKAS